MSPSIVLHGTALSGHSHRVENLLRMLGVPYRFVHAPAEVRATPAFRRLNAFGQIPVLEDVGDDGGAIVLADSNAILVYLCKRYGAGTGWLPEAPVAAAEVQRWLSIAAGEVRFGPGVARLATLWPGRGGAGAVAAAHEVSASLFRFTEEHLDGRAFLAAAHATLADLACYSYVSHAPEGRLSLEPYPAIRAWLARVEALPGFVAMPRTPIPEPVLEGVS